MSRPPGSKPLDALGLATVVFCCALWGGNPIAVKFSVPDLPPFACAGLRFLLSLPVLLLLCKATGQPIWPGRGKLGLVLVHALFTFAQIGTFNWGTNLSLAGRASVFINVHPFVVAPLSWLFLGEKPGWKGIGGLIAAAGGIGILLGSRVDLAAGALLGDLVVIISGVIFGVQTVVQKRTFPSLSPATLLVNQAAMVVPMFLGYSLLFEAGEPWRFTRSATLGLLYQGLAVSGLCFSLWLLLVRRHRASQIATLAFLTPVFGVTFGSLFRGEPLGWSLVLSVSLVGAGIYLVASERPAAPVGTGPEPIAPPEDGPVVATRA